IAAARLYRSFIEGGVGAEYAYGNRFFRALERDEELVTFRHDGERCILIELPLDRPVIGVRRVARRLLGLGIRPVLAHPERLAEFLADLIRIRSWLEAGWFFQLNLPSLEEAHGREACSLARDLVRRNQYTFLGSDLHRPGELDLLRRAHGTYRTLTREEARP
ncbi:MAG: CpsB/CapC family capsule biosynthesis tyrosine phosphatase, partial [Planctomycetota bacterium]